MRIFDIRRFSTHDGDGIRTTVFFKGCPLSCVWCHNPEGIDMAPRPLYFPKKCVGCGTCLAMCRHGGMERADQGGDGRTDQVGDGRTDQGKHGRPDQAGEPPARQGLRLNADRAEDWDGIMEECPAGAIVWDSREMTVEEVTEQVLQDEPFFRHGGGVTLSGGEPLAQHREARELLRELKRRGIHTALETSLFGPQEAGLGLFSRLDPLYADFKIYDTGEHRRLTGVPNERIKENIRLLLESEKRDCTVIRTPMIPGMTADPENITAISRYISGIYEHVSYELLNYNPLAEAKYPLVDRVFSLKGIREPYSSQAMKAFADAAAAGGTKHVIIKQER